MKDGSVGKVGRGTGVGNCQITQSLNGQWFTLSMIQSLNHSMQGLVELCPPVGEAVIQRIEGLVQSILWIDLHGLRPLLGR